MAVCITMQPSIAHVSPLTASACIGNSVFPSQSSAPGKKETVKTIVLACVANTTRK